MNPTPLRPAPRKDPGSRLRQAPGRKTFAWVGWALLAVLLTSCIQEDQTPPPPSASAYKTISLGAPTPVLSYWGTENRAPVLAGTPVATVDQDQTFAFTPLALDPDGDPLSFTLRNRPRWAAFDPATGTLSGTPGQGDVGVFDAIVLSASDGRDSASLPPFRIEVRNRNDPPTIAGQPPTRVEQDHPYVFTAQASDPDTVYGQKLTFAIDNLPSWATFGATTGTLSGTPGNEDVGLYQGIRIQVRDGNGLTATLPPFSIAVLNQNDPPSLAGNPSGILVSGQSYRFAPTAVDPDLMHGQTLSYSIQNKPAWAHFNSATGELTGVPGPGETGTVSDIVITVSDGLRSSHLPAFSLRVTEAPLMLTLTADPGAAAYAGGQIQFSAVLTYAGGGTEDVTARVRWKSETPRLAWFSSAKGREGLLDTVAGGQAGVSAVDPVTGLASAVTWLPIGYPDTAGDLVISEVGAAEEVNSSFWFEVYNRGTEPANLARYQLRSWSFLRRGETYQEGGRHLFTLPQATISPGGYLLVRGNPLGEDAPKNTSQGVQVRDDATGHWPQWFRDGFVELLREGATRDFIRFGKDLTEPQTPGEWVHTPAPALLMPGVGAPSLSLARDAALTDTNSGSDWSLRVFPTPGGPNDIDCVEDRDVDGIPDCAEHPGATFNGLPLYAWGARPGVTDVFLEVDVMDSKDEGVLPRRQALERVAQAFAPHTVALHFDVGDLFDQTTGLSPKNNDLGGGGLVPFTPSLTLGAGAPGQTDFYAYKNRFMDLRRKPIFHYILFAASTQPKGGAGPWGQAEQFGNDLIISLGGWGLNSTTPNNRNLLVNYQALALMHELGHNLGLTHGGDGMSGDAEWNKPNYLSIMNDLYARVGLPDIGSATEGDRYYFGRYAAQGYSGPCGRYIEFIAQLDTPPNADPSRFRMDYSAGSGYALDESFLVEADGLGRAESAGVDYDCDGVRESGAYALDLNGGLGMTSRFNVLSDSNDWANLLFFFALGTSGSLEPTSAGPRAWEDPVGNDHQPVFFEPPLPLGFLDEVLSLME
ncbi:MAG: putative Ig domain-containing protein [Deltaproteobacteria bacterium]|nr:putative Ig domain-containing protein [Deltaproteobacteria bacterium]